MMSVIEGQTIKRRGGGFHPLSRTQRPRSGGGDVINRIMRFKRERRSTGLFAVAAQQRPARRVPKASSPRGVRLSSLVAQNVSVFRRRAAKVRRFRGPASSPLARHLAQAPARRKVSLQGGLSRMQAFVRTHKIPILPSLVHGAGLVLGAGSQQLVAAVAHQRRDLDIAFLVAVVFSALFAAQAITPGSMFDELLVSRPVYVLPESGEIRGVLANSLEPRNNYDVMGDILHLDPAQFTALEVSSYRMVAGDTLSAIATRHGLRMDTLVSFNQLDDVRRMQIGQELRIPNRDGLLYTVKRGDTLESIALNYGTSSTAILDANDLLSTEIRIGELLFVPDARMNQTELAIVLGDAFRWPTTGRFTSGFGMRRDPFTGVRRFHNGIDLANVPGTAVLAAMSGTVVHVENQPGNYGRFVILRHDRGYQTLYAHLDSWNVRVGQRVTQGQRIGTMGNTGRSTGPHLHFSIIRNGTFVDPMRYLR